MSDCDKCYEENKIGKSVRFQVEWPGKVKEVTFELRFE